MPRSVRIGLIFLVSLTAQSCTALGQSDDGPSSHSSLAADAIAAADQTTSIASPELRIKADIAFLADDAQMGREAGTPGYDRAAQYVARRFEALGLEPGGDFLSPRDRGWRQQVPMRSARRDPKKAIFTIRLKNGDEGDGAELALTHLEDFLIGRSMTQSAFGATAPAIFAGYGVTAPEENYDDFGGLDVEGKIIFAYSGAPDIFDGERRAFYASSDYKQKNAAKHGAIGLVTLPTAASEKRRPWARIIAKHEKASMTWIGPDGAADVPARQIRVTAALSMTGARRVFSLAGAEYEPLPVIINDGAAIRAKRTDLPVKITIGGRSEFSSVESSNVVGIIEGSDRDLQRQAIVLSAHLDHVGYRTPDKHNGDGIHNGALDNAMGVAAMLDAARAFKAGVAPKRTVIFLATTAEEKGLLGADYFAHHPSLGDKQIVANINLDMPLTLFPFSDVVAFGANRSSLGRVVTDAAASMGVAVIPDPIAEFGIFTRSDHYRFVEQGIPAIYLFVGFGNGGEKIIREFMKYHYHQPSDELTLPIDYDAAARFAELNYLVAKAVADQPDPPEWVEGDFFGGRFAQP